MWIIEPQGLKFLHVPDPSDGHFDGVPVISKGHQKVVTSLHVAESLSGLQTWVLLSSCSLGNRKGLPF